MTTTVEEFISGKLPVISVRLSDSLIHAVRLMLRHDYSQLPVLDSEAKPIGIITSDSILKGLYNYNEELKDIQIKHVMLKKPQIFKQDIDLLDLFDEMDGPFAFIVDRDGRLVQIITEFDTTEYFRQRARDIILVENIENTLKDFVQQAFSSMSDGETRLNKAIQSIDSSRDSSSLRLRSNFKKGICDYLELTQGNETNQVNESALVEAFSRHFVETKTPATFDDLTLANYISLFLSNDNWSYLEGVFGLEKKALSNLLESMRLTRNDLAHFREIGYDQSRQLRDCYDLLVDHQDAISTAFSARDALNEEAEHPLNEASEPETGIPIPVADEPRPGESRYAALAIWLQEQSPRKDAISTTFNEVQAIIGEELPSSAYKNRSWWANDSVGHVQSKQWLDVGWRVAGVNMSEQTVRFARIKDRERNYIEFYNVVIDKLRKVPGFEQTPSSPDGTNWHTVKSIRVEGKLLAWLTFAFGRGGTFRVELYIDCGDEKINKRLFDDLHADKAEIEEEIGHELDWHRLDNKRASRLGRIFEGRITDSEDELHALAEKASAAMTILSNVLEPRVVKIGQKLQ